MTNNWLLFVIIKFGLKIFVEPFTSRTWSASSMLSITLPITILILDDPQPITMADVPAEKKDSLFFPG